MSINNNMSIMYVTSSKAVLGAVLLELRRDRCATQKELGEFIELTSGLISNLENGIGEMSLTYLKSISSAFGLNVWDILETASNREMMLRRIDVYIDGSFSLSAKEAVEKLKGDDKYQVRMLKPLQGIALLKTLKAVKSNYKTNNPLEQ